MHTMHSPPTFLMTPILKSPSRMFRSEVSACSGHIATASHCAPVSENVLEAPLGSSRVRPSKKRSGIHAVRVRQSERSLRSVIASGRCTCMPITQQEHAQAHARSFNHAARKHGVRCHHAQGSMQHGKPPVNRRPHTVPGAPHEGPRSDISIPSMEYNIPDKLKSAQVHAQQLFNDCTVFAPFSELVSARYRAARPCNRYSAPSMHGQVLRSAQSWHAGRCPVLPQDHPPTRSRAWSQAEFAPTRATQHLPQGGSGAHTCCTCQPSTAPPPPLPASRTRMAAAECRWEPAQWLALSIPAPKVFF